MLTEKQVYIELLHTIRAMYQSGNERYRYIYTNTLESFAKEEYLSGELWKKWLEKSDYKSLRKFIEKWIHQTLMSPKYQSRMDSRRKISDEIDKIQEFYALPYAAVWNIQSGEIIPVQEGEHWSTISTILKANFGNEVLENTEMYPRVDAWIQKNIRIKGAYFDSSAYTIATHSPLSFSNLSSKPVGMVVQ